MRQEIVKKIDVSLVRDVHPTGQPCATPRRRHLGTRDPLRPGLHDPVRHARGSAELQPPFVARCAKAGVPTITVRDARRTGGSLLAALDVPPRVVMEIRRHTEFSLTMEIYTQVSSRDTQEALRRLGESLDR